jgi:Uncharacterized protein family UPF0029
MNEINDVDNVSENDIERAIADIEILVSAYPDEIEIDKNNIIVQKQQQRQRQQQIVVFPIYVIFRLSNTAQITFQYIIGYPITSTITIASYRCNPNETIRMEATITAIKQTADECLKEQIECSLSCCSAAMVAWDDNIDCNDNNSNYHTPSSLESGVDSSSSEINNNNTNNSKNNNISSRIVESYNNLPNEQMIFQFTTTTPHIEKKSVFEAYVCTISSEQDVPIALHQLLSSHNRFQRATHNMVSFF